MAHSPHHQADPRFTVRQAHRPEPSRGTLHASRFTVPLNSILLALLCFVATACSTTAPTGKVFFDDPHGTLSLQTMSDQSIQANHPVNLDPTLLAKVLQGLEVQEKEAFGIQNLVAGPTGSTPAFSDDQIRFLAPLLAEGLRRATPDESVQFLVRTAYDGSLFESSSTETTSGSLYAYGRQLYVTLSQYRSSLARANQNLGRGTSRPNPPDFTGLRDRILFFTPKVAQRSDSFDPPARAKPTDRFVAVDYELLQQTPTATYQTVPQVERAAPIPSSQAGTKASEATSSTTEALAQEVETLRKELRSVQEQLGSQPTKPDSLKRKPTPQKK
ncbi:MAG: hypothetical protein CAF45_000420 [Nitrospira sp. CG24E]|nr:MAG: hypothetical protein CAF45_000420 [Nitrospira sp. CG24E]